MEFFGYETCDKLIWTSGEDRRDTNTIRKKVIPKNNINKTFTSSTLVFGCFPHKYTRYILSEDFVSQRLQAYSLKMRGVY